jgi:murein tripeptide amidase MpaA
MHILKRAPTSKQMCEIKFLSSDFYNFSSKPLKERAYIFFWEGGGEHTHNALRLCRLCLTSLLQKKFQGGAPAL